MTRRARRPILAGAGLLLALALFTVHVSPPAPVVAPIRIRWAPAVGADAQAAGEFRLRLRRGQPHGERTWNYELLDTSRDNIRAVITDPAVEDTDGLDRQNFRIAAAPVTMAELVTDEFPALERLAGRGFRAWLSWENAWPAALAVVWIMAIGRRAVRAAVFQGIPPLSPLGLGLFRIALGLALLVAIPAAAPAPGASLPLELHRTADWFADWGWVHWLAAHPDGSAVVLGVGLTALVLFAAGVLPRAMYVVAVTAITARVLVLLQFRSAHDVGLPLVALWGLVLVPWNAGLTMGARRRADDRARYGFAVWLPGVVLGLGLLAAGYAKLDTSGAAWITGGAVKYHFIEDFRQAPTTWGLWIAAHHGWAVAASLAAVAFELCFVVHVFFRQPGVRAVFGSAAAAFLAGLYLLQGIAWPLWWVLLLAFIPWESLAGALTRAGVALAPALAPVPTQAQVAIVGAFVCIQIFASARRVEVQPFVSDYGMYSWTWSSAAAFDRQIARKYRAYHYIVDSAGETVDITDRMDGLPGAMDGLTEAIDYFRDASSLRPDHRNALRTIGAMYASSYREPSPQVTVLLDQEAFDWTRARFVRKADRGPIGVIDLSIGTFVPTEPVPPTSGSERPAAAPPERREQ